MLKTSYFAWNAASSSESSRTIKMLCKRAHRNLKMQHPFAITKQLRMHTLHLTVSLLVEPRFKPYIVWERGAKIIFQGHRNVQTRGSQFLNFIT